MDCVTCLLVGMCMLCGQKLGGSKLQTLSSPEAANPGRPLTRAEVDTALQSAIRHLNANSNSNTNSYLRQSKLDPRFSHMGIGKRYGTKIDPYNFAVGLGKRQQDSEERQSDDIRVLDASDSMTEASRIDPRLMSSEDALNLEPQDVSYSYTDDNPLILSQILERSRTFTVPDDSQPREADNRKLRLRTLQQRLQPLSSLNGARR